MRPLVFMLAALASSCVGSGHAFASCESAASSCKAGCPDDATTDDFFKGGAVNGLIKGTDHTNCIVGCDQRYRACTASQERNGQSKTAPAPALPQNSGEFPVCEGGWNASRSRPGEAPSRADLLAAQQAIKEQDIRRANALLRKIDEEGIAALSQLPPSTPWLDVLISKQLDIISWARSQLGAYYLNGAFTDHNDREAAKWYYKSINTKYVDEERRCIIIGSPGGLVVATYAVMHLYGLGVQKSEEKARQVLAGGHAGAYGNAILTVLNYHALPATYEELLKTNIPALAARLQGR